jgi:superfamily II RNA helicase
MPNRKIYHRRFPKEGYRKKRRTRRDSYENPRLDPALRPIFQHIGTPDPTPFTPDPFQVEALEALRDDDVLVSAPTGAGKTWIASQASQHYLSQGLKVWYASPLKALSNAIYGQFCHEFGGENCGILTGDRKENPDAPIIVGTTEILRNQLYDAMHMGTDIRADLVILDEAHYLSDPDRGVVWEEVLIYLPARVKLLLLSATIPNGEEICGWLKKNRKRPARVIRANERPVPLEMLFIFPDGYITSLGGKRGLAARVKRYVSSKGGQRRGSRRIPFGEIIQCLRKFDLLPAIFFLKSRMDCNKAILSCDPVERSTESGKRLRSEVRSFLREYPHLEGHRQIDNLMHSAVGAHHAGQLPYWKVLIERLMNRGYLEAIFSTSTVAAGVNFPARTVVLVQSDRYDGHGFTDLTATDLHQMIGRAGRRGKDNVGFALVVPGIHQNPQLIYELRDSAPEPLGSRIHINFSMTLNLLLSHRPWEIKDLLDRSFASFQGERIGSSVQDRWHILITRLKGLLPKGRCDAGDPHEILDYIQKRSELKREAAKLGKRIKREAIMQAYASHLEPGQLFLHRNKTIYVVFHTYMEEGKLFCDAHNIEKRVKSRKGKIRFRRVAWEKIKGIFDYRIDLSGNESAELLQNLFDRIPVEALELIQIKHSEEQDSGELDAVRKRLRALPCETCGYFKDCHTKKNRELHKILDELRTLLLQFEGRGGGLWISFKHHLRFLKETGFVDDADHLTPDGLWASKLRLDHPLLIAEAIRKGAFESISPEILSGCISPFVWDRVQDLELKVHSPISLDVMGTAFSHVMESIEHIRGLKVKRGFDNPPILFWPSASLYLWAKGLPWDQLIHFVPVEEGDMASLVMRTADHLRQVINLSESHPDLAHSAEAAIELILREPVYLS